MKAGALDLHLLQQNPARLLVQSLGLRIFQARNKLRRVIQRLKKSSKNQSQRDLDRQVLVEAMLLISQSTKGCRRHFLGFLPGDQLQDWLGTLLALVLHLRQRSDGILAQQKSKKVQEDIDLVETHLPLSHKRKRPSMLVQWSPFMRNRLA